jgi:hypothetical protein
MLKTPEILPSRDIKVNNSEILLFTPQIVEGMAMFPIKTSENYGIEPIIIENAMLNRDIFIRDNAGGYNTMSVERSPSSNQDVLIPAGTHFIGGKQNRGNDKLQLVTENGSKRIEAHCFEPERGSGSETFDTVSETPIDIVFQTMSSRGTGASWGIIDTYHRIFGRSGGSLKNFLDKTEKERFHLALNYETLREQTGVLSVIGNTLIAMEIYPNKQAFEKHRDDIYSGKFASMLWKQVKEGKSRSLTPQDVHIRVDAFIEKLKAKLTDSPRAVPIGNYKIISARENGFVSDVVMNDANELVYLFAMNIVR